MYKTLRVLVCAAAVCLGGAVQAQNIGNTPYSRFGLGELNPNLGNIRNAGMAGIGVSAGNSFQPNTANPALLYYNSITVFDLGISGQLKNIKDGQNSQLDGNGNLALLTLAVPLSKRWSSALSLRPYSNVDYQIISTSPLEDNPSASVTRQYAGEGGLTELYFGHGVRVASGLTVGASASYLFGTITKESASLITDNELAGLQLERVIFSERSRYTGLVFRTGANYRKGIKDNLFLSAGAVYGLQSDVNVNRKTAYERRTIYEVVEDQNILPDSSKSKVSLPSSFQFGLSLDNGSNFTIGTEFQAQQWSKYRNISNVQELANSYRAALGVEYTPNPNSIDNYLKRITYRGGAYYGNTPYSITNSFVSNEQIVDRGLTFGFTAPIGRGSLYDLYQMNASIAGGRRGTTENGLIAEDYLQFNVGVTINSRWFLKRRLE